MDAVNHLHFLYDRSNISTGVICLTKGLTSLKKKVHALCEYMKALVSRLINLLFVHPDDIRKILVRVKHENYSLVGTSR